MLIKKPKKLYWTPGGSRQDPLKQSLSENGCPDALLNYQVFFSILAWYQKPWCYEIVRDKARFFGKVFLLKKFGKWTKNRPKPEFLKFIENFCHQFFLILFYNENLYHLLRRSCTNLMFGKTFVPEICAKMISASQIAGFLNQPYFRNKPIKQPEFLIGCGQSTHGSLTLTASQE